jgi:hypothetical protein
MSQDQIPLVPIFFFSFFFLSFFCIQMFYTIMKLLIILLENVNKSCTSASSLSLMLPFPFSVGGVGSNVSAHSQQPGV